MTIIQDILNYYRTDFTDRLNTHERMRAIKLIMGKALHYQ